MADRENVVFVVLIDQKSRRVADLLEMLGDRRQKRLVDGVRVAEQLDIVEHDFGGWHGRTVRHRPAGGMQDRNSKLDRVEIGFCRLAEDIIGVKFDRLAARLRVDRRHKRLQSLLVENSGRIVEQQRVDIAARQKACRPCRHNKRQYAPAKA